MLDKDFGFDEEDELSMLETLDHVLERGLVIAGEITISVANIDLIFVGLNVILGSVDTIDKVIGERMSRNRALAAGEAEAQREPPSRPASDEGSQGEEG